MDEKQFVIALAVGMNAAAEVARLTGFDEAAEAIRAYEKDWSAKVNPPQPRQMQRGDICPDATRYAIAADFGFTPKDKDNGR